MKILAAIALLGFMGACLSYASDPLDGIPGGAVVPDCERFTIQRNEAVLVEWPKEKPRALRVERLKSGLFVNYTDPSQSRLRSGTYVYRIVTPTDTVTVGTLTVGDKGRSYRRGA